MYIVKSSFFRLFPIFYCSLSIPQSCSQGQTLLLPFSLHSPDYICKGMYGCITLLNTNGSKLLGYNLSIFSFLRKLNIISYPCVYLPHSSYYLKRIHECSMTCHSSTGGYSNYSQDFVIVNHSPIYTLAQVFLNKGE